MKKLTCCLLILAIIFSFAFGTAAWAEETNTVEIKTQFGKLELELDESRWGVITRDNLKNNPLLEKLGLDPEVEAEFMDEDDVYADAILLYNNSNAYFEMVVIEKELKNNYDFSSFSDKLLEEVAAAAIEDLDGQESGVFSNSDDLNFVYCDYKSEGIYVREYFTAMGESRLNFLFQSNEPFIDEEYEEMEKIMNGVDFTPKAGAKRGFKMPSVTDLLASLGFGYSDAREEGLSRFELETEVGTLRLKMDEEFWYVFTRENLKDNPELDELNFDYESMAEFMEEQNVRMDAIVFYEDSDAYLEMFVIEKENDNFYDDSLVNDSDFEELAGEMADKLGFESGEMFKSNKGIRFMGFEFSDSGMYVKEYIFVTKDISFAIHFESNEPFIEEEYEDMETILDSFDFTPKATTKVWPDA